MNLIILHPSEVDSDGSVRLVDERARHIRKVLRAEPGKQLRVGLLNGALGSATVVEVDKEQATLLCLFEEELPPKPRVDLLLAMPRPKVMKRLWAQLAALGVGRIVLLNANKVERFYFDSHVIEPSFYNNLLVEGLQQARCTHLPEVHVRERFKPFVEDELEVFADKSLCLLAEPTADQDLSDVVSLIKPSQRILLAIGPEGGWTAYEVKKLIEKGFLPVRYGNRILRSDTACIGLLSTIQHFL
jgi:RsmE family RNA methyltransferase